MNTLAPRVQGAMRPSLQITWADEDGAPLNLTGATVTARIRNMATRVTTTSAGAFALVDAPNGVFRWDFDATDVAAAGEYQVQFTATYGLAPTPARTFIAQWRITEAL